jgi:hypothetical protein
MTLLVVVLLISLRWWAGGSVNPVSLAQAHLTTYQPQLDPSAHPALAAVQAAYAAENEEEAVARIIEQLEGDSLLSPAAESELTLALANFNLRQGHPDLGRTRLLGHGPFASKEQEAEAAWMLALSHLAERNVPAARRSLQVLLEDDLSLHDEAANTLLQELADWQAG